MAEIEIGLEVRVERADVAPVLRGLLVLVVEAVHVDRRCARCSAGNDVLAEIVARRPLRVFFEGRDEHVGVEHVDAHRRQRHVRVVRHRRRVGGFFLESGDPAAGVGLQDPEAARLVERHLERGDASLPRRSPCGRAASCRSPSCRRGRPTARRCSAESSWTIEVEVLVDGVSRAESTSARRRASAAAGSR